MSSSFDSLILGSDSSEKDNSMSMGGKMRKGRMSNGHKLHCGCPICKNMRKKKGGADDEMDSEEKFVEKFVGSMEGGSRRSRRRSGRSRSARRSRTSRRSRSSRRSRTSRRH